VLCLFEMTENGGTREYHELCSLASGGLVTALSGNRNWSPAAAQLTMAPLRDAPPPAESPRQRLGQMRELAGRITCEKTTRTGDTRALRLLSQPLARYESKTHEVIDGGLFAFVEATDPEVFSAGDAKSRHHAPMALRLSSHGQRADGGFARRECHLGSRNAPVRRYRNRPDLPYNAALAR